MFDYTFRGTPEFYWAVLQTVVGAVAGFIVSSPLPVPGDLKPWLIALAAAAARPVVALIFGSKAP